MAEAHAFTETEAGLRERLGIPAEAERVLVFGESSHWDPNWLLTSEEYYERRIESILDEVLDALEREPRRVFSLECLFFVQMYWDRRPDRRDELRELVNEGRIAFTGTGITTPDTVLPSTEAILRDYLLGQQWLRDNGMTAEPRLAYLPDDFGHSPALPSILRALGFDRAGITRIDGMRFIGSDYRLPSSYPLEGSSAELLRRDLRTVDFVWRGPDGSEVLTHWNAFTYFQGDMLAHVGIIRWMGTAYGVPWRTGAHIARRVRGLVRQLAPLSRTPYLFCPIGCDFNGPIEGLLELLDRYNETRYPDTGVWTVCASMDDHLALVDCHRDELPVLELDPNPYWMGFYATRPGIKGTCNRVARKLVLAEKLAVRARGPHGPPPEEIAPAWDLVAVTNHHDFITGTSPDRVFEAEQLPWMERAEELADRALGRVLPEPEVRRRPQPAPPIWRLADGRLEVETKHYRLALSEERGGCIVALRSPPDGPELLAGPANDLVAYRDSGGLWRMGHEFRGGTFREIARTSDRPAAIEVDEHGGLLSVRVEGELRGRRVVRRLWLRGDAPLIRLEAEGAAARRTTVTCRFPTISGASALHMNVPGGVVERPLHKLYVPTFWPARSFAHMADRHGWGLAAFLGGPACVALTDPGVVEWVVFRDAPVERAFGVLPIPAHPARGSESGDTVVDYAVWVTGPGGWAQHHLPRHVRHALRAALFAPGEPDLDALANAVVASDRPDVLVTALKPASHGPGLVARLRLYAARGEPVDVVLRCSVQPVREARRCDARERDLETLPVDEDGLVRLRVDAGIVSVRLVF